MKRSIVTDHNRRSGVLSKAVFCSTLPTVLLRKAFDPQKDGLFRAGPFMLRIPGRLISRIMAVFIETVIESAIVGYWWVFTM